MNMKEIDYRNMLVVGIILSAMAAAAGLFPLSVLAVSLILIALANRSKWKK